MRVSTRDRALFEATRSINREQLDARVERSRERRARALWFVQTCALGAALAVALMAVAAALTGRGAP